MNLDPKQTDALRAVVESGSFEQAAQALFFLTPSAVSQRVRALEIRIGSALLLRTRPVRATQTGQRLLQYLRRVALLQHDLDDELNQPGRRRCRSAWRSTPIAWPPGLCQRWGNWPASIASCSI